MSKPCAAKASLTICCSVAKSGCISPIVWSVRYLGWSEPISLIMSARDFLLIGALVVELPPVFPLLNPGIFPEIIPLINPEYLVAIFAGITASPGDSIAGTTSPAPFGPGTLNTPLAYFFGFAPRLPTALGPVNAVCAATAF